MQLGPPEGVLRARRAGPQISDSFGTAADETRRRSLRAAWLRLNVPQRGEVRIERMCSALLEKGYAFEANLGQPSRGLTLIVAVPPPRVRARSSDSHRRILVLPRPQPDLCRPDKHAAGFLMVSFHLDIEPVRRVHVLWPQGQDNSCIKQTHLAVKGT